MFQTVLSVYYSQLYYGLQAKFEINGNAWIISFSEFEVGGIVYDIAPICYTLLVALYLQ